MEDRAYFVMATQKNEAGQLRALCAVRGRKGYYLTSWYWGHNLELAEKIAARKNDLLGVTEDQAQSIILSTM